tara:strand:+ start:515 stop:652 length:138 start_codon:yes stop_codon:yes gene_type:complete
MKNDVMDALEYFHGAGMIENMSGDQRHYVEQLMNFVANQLNIELV